MAKKKPTFTIPGPFWVAASMGQDLRLAIIHPDGAGLSVDLSLPKVSILIDALQGHVNDTILRNRIKMEAKKKPRAK